MNCHTFVHYLHWCWRLCTLLNLETGWISWTRMGPRTGRRCKKKRYRPDLECWTAFSMKSTMVLLLKLVRCPKLKLPVREYEITVLHLPPLHLKAWNQSYLDHVLSEHASHFHWAWKLVKRCSDRRSSLWQEMNRRALHSIVSPPHLLRWGPSTSRTEKEEIRYSISRSTELRKSSCLW